MKAITTLPEYSCHHQHFAEWYFIASIVHEHSWAYAHEFAAFNREDKKTPGVQARQWLLKAPCALAVHSLDPILNISLKIGSALILDSNHGTWDIWDMGHSAQDNISSILPLQ
eukprot:1159095-Pelagomonas_calceolata.AAC.6